MIAGLSVLAILPARGGSKGVPRKNIRTVAGQPLIAWTISAARASRYIDRFVLSSEDDEIMEIARRLGCEVPFKRPAELARDETPGIDPVLHALTEISGFDIVILLQPTSPLREGSDIDECLELLTVTGAPACISIREAADHPYWTCRRDAGGRLHSFFVPAEGIPTRRQDLPRAFVANGAVYVARVDWLLNSRSFETNDTVGFEMSAERSVDVDHEDDLASAELMLLKRRPPR